MIRPILGMFLFLFPVLLFTYSINAYGQGSSKLQWSKSGSSFYAKEDEGIYEFTLPGFASKLIVPAAKLITSGNEEPLDIKEFSFSTDEKKLLIFANTRKVWRYNTRGDYWIFDMQTGLLKQLGKRFKPASLMFAKISPDGSSAAYVQERNIYLEDLKSGKIRQLTFDGTRQLINGTFDWAYEEEFFCRDGFRWSPDSKKIAFWQIDARKVKDYLMTNNTDSIYPFVIPVEYPVAGEAPSPYRIGVVEVSTATKHWMNIPGNPSQYYVPRMEWAANSDELILQQLTRKQNESKIFLCNAQTGATRSIYQEKDSAWIDILAIWDEDYSVGGWDWLNKGKEFLWASEKDGWRHVYRVSRDGTHETLLTKGNYDVIDISRVDETGNYLYFLASPDNATQKFLYRTPLDGSGAAQRVSPLAQPGTHMYDISPNARFAMHGFSSHMVKPASEWVDLAINKTLGTKNEVDLAIAAASRTPSNLSFFKITTNEGIEMDAWIVKPAHFDSTKKYPIVFFVYTEPWGQEVKDEYGVGKNKLYNGDMAEDGYIYIAIDNRGTPVAKGRAWRKAVYRKIGLVNIRDQAMAAQKILEWPFVDSSRIAVWGWSGGGSATLNLMFQYPEIYKTGIAIAAVGNQLTYDNIYQERYMGLPQENKQDFINGSPITYAKNLKGNLLYIHGTGDDNVHFQNAEMLVDELVKYNKQFQLMIYPNRTHSISERDGTKAHLSTLYTSYLRQYCPPGAK